MPRGGWSAERVRLLLKSSRRAPEISASVLPCAADRPTRSPFATSNSSTSAQSALASANLVPARAPHSSRCCGLKTSERPSLWQAEQVAVLSSETAVRGLSGERRCTRTRERFDCREVRRSRKIWRQNHGAAAIEPAAGRFFGSGAQSFAEIPGQDDARKSPASIS